MRASLSIVALTFALLAGCVGPERAPREVAYDDLRRVVALLDDVAAEYPRAVMDGRVVDAPRMKVLETMLHDAQLFASRFTPDEQRKLHEIAELAATHRQAEQLTRRAGALRRELLSSHRLVLAPAAPLDRPRAEALWDWLCAGCHGVTGMGDGPQGLGLVPEPKDFHEAAFMAELAPSRAFSQISDGVRGTAMPQWGLFTKSERWGLAFLVFAFRHEPEAVARGRVLVAVRGIPASMSAVSDLTDRQVLEAMQRRGLTEAQATDVLAYLRAEAPFAWASGPLVAVRRQLGDLASSNSAQRPRRAALLAAARQTLAPLMVAIRAGSPKTAIHLEQRLVELEHSLDSQLMDEMVERHIANLGPLLDDAEQVLRAPTSVVGGLRLAAEWLLAASIALGFSLRRHARMRTSFGAAVVALALGAVGACTAATSVTVLLQLFAVTLIVIGAVRSSRASLGRVLLLAVLVGTVAGPLIGALHGTLAHAVVVGVAALGVLLGLALHAASLRITNVTAASALVIACAGITARATETLAGARTLDIPRIDAIGLVPSPLALATAGVVALALALALALTRSRPPMT